MDEPAFTAWWSRLLRSGTSPGSVRAIFELNYEIDVREILPAVLVVHAREDRLLPERLGRFLAEHIPRARFVSLPSGDHIPFPTVGDELAAEVQAFLTGDRPAPDVERVLTTLLFTDVVGSTERAAQPGDRRCRDLLQDYRGVAREQLARLGGREVSTSGEGMLARFDGPARAVQCGQAIVAAAAGRGLAVRAGVHTGECELVGDDLAGLAVHIGARIAELAAGGEVLVSSTVKDLVFGSELRFAERGEHELRGLPGRWRLFSAMP